VLIICHRQACSRSSFGMKRSLGGVTSGVETPLREIWEVEREGLRISWIMADTAGRCHLVCNFRDLHNVDEKGAARF
jgi:hypothetical protein